MKRFGPGLACVLAMTPGVASAALSIAIGPDAFSGPADPQGERYFDLVFQETGPATNEGLFAYVLALRRNLTGINLVRAEKPENWVFASPSASFLEHGPEFSNKPGLIVVEAVGDILGASQDIVGGTKAARVFYTIDPNAGMGYYHIYLDPAGTLFVSGDTGEAIPIDISDPGLVIVWPEPTSMPLLAVAGVGVLAMRRRQA